jgi:hypothetical protein
MTAHLASDKSGNLQFTGDGQSLVLGPTNSACTTLIDLKGSATGNITLRYYGL